MDCGAEGDTAVFSTMAWAGVDHAVFPALAGEQHMNDTARHLVEYTCEDHIAIITLNRPEKLNAFSDDMVMALSEALRRSDIDHDAFVAIIHGAGRAFSSGADVRQRQLRRREEFEQHGGPQGWGAHARATC
jgi:enoyl-CoA hydratase/carnithine racemase